MEDKMVVLRRFRQFSEANMLANLLQAEGVACYVRDNVTHQIFGDIDFVSVKIELLEKDLPRAEEIMKAYGYALSDDQADNVMADGSEDEEKIEAMEETDAMAETEEMADDFEDMETAEAEIIAYQKFKKRQARMLSVICILLIIVGGLIIILNKYYNEQ